MQNSTLVWIILAALVVLGGGWYFFNNQNSVPASVQENTSGQTPVEEENESVSVGAGVTVGAGTGGSSEEGAAPMTANVAYTANGFSPSTVTVKVGGTVTWQNTGTGSMWVASASHPTHTGYDGTTREQHCGSGADAFDQCENGNTFSFTFDKPGTWRYHNHSQASHFGTVIVEE